MHTCKLDHLGFYDIGYYVQREGDMEWKSVWPKDSERCEEFDLAYAVVSWLNGGARPEWF